MICPACNKETNKPVTHHWYELPDLKHHTKDICASCNSLLVTGNFYKDMFSNDLDHVLPSWDKQLAFIQSYKGDNSSYTKDRNLRSRDIKQIAIDKSTYERLLSFRKYGERMDGILIMIMDLADRVKSR
jgi:hypothetical protein